MTKETYIKIVFIVFLMIALNSFFNASISVKCCLYKKLSLSSYIDLPLRVSEEFYVGSSIQFRIKLKLSKIPKFLSSCFKRGVDLKWFGNKEPIGFTSRYHSWRYFDEIQTLPKTIKILSNTIDMRIPLTFNSTDCKLISDIILEELNKIKLN